MVLIFASTALFFYLIATKIELVFSHQRNVNLDILYNDTIRFPTVTICNQNPIRLNLCTTNIINRILHFLHPHLTSSHPSLFFHILPILLLF